MDMKRKPKSANDLYESGTRAVSTPMVQNDTLCSAGQYQGPAIPDLESKLEHLSRIHMSASIFARIQLQGGLRVSELLNVKARDIDKLGRMKVKGLKGSNDRIVDINAHLGFLAPYIKAGFLPWEQWDRFVVYRAYKKAGIGLDIEGGVKKAVTHALRHISTQLLEDNTEKMTAAKALLGHVSSSNTEIYVKQTSAKVLNRRKKANTGKTGKANDTDTKERSCENQTVKSEKKKK